MTREEIRAKVAEVVKVLVADGFNVGVTHYDVPDYLALRYLFSGEDRRYECIAIFDFNKPERVEETAQGVLDYAERHKYRRDAEWQQRQDAAASWKREEARRLARLGLAG